MFMEETSFMQGGVGLTLMPSNPSSRTPRADLASLARLIFGSDKLYGFFCSVSHFLGALIVSSVCTDDQQLS